MAIMRLLDENGEFINIPAIQGAPGPQGPQGPKGDAGEAATTYYWDGSTDKIDLFQSFIDEYINYKTIPSVMSHKISVTSPTSANINLFLSDIEDNDTYFTFVWERRFDMSTNAGMTGIDIPYWVIRKNNVSVDENNKVTSVSPIVTGFPYDVYALTNASEVTGNYYRYAALSLSNTTEYIPTAPYHPATKKYVDDTVGDIESILNEVV